MNATAQSVIVSRTFRSTKEAAFDAWTNPASLAQWFGPPGFRAKILTHDLRVGGDWRFLMTDDKGQGFHHFGTFIAIEPTDKLAFTWGSEEQVEGWRDEAGNPTLVTVTFEENADRVTVVITHENLATEPARRGLTLGWGEGLACLAEFLRWGAAER